MNTCEARLSSLEQWNARRYLQHYYARVEADEVATLGFITRVCERIESPGVALVFGVGPTVHHLLPLAPHARELHVADYLESNLAHVRGWLRADPQAHDWRPFVQHVLCCEGESVPSHLAIARREHLVRSRVTRCMRADAGREQPLFAPVRARYDLVLSCYCAESATGDRTVWRRYLRNILHLLAPGGLFITAALRRCSAYRVGPQRFACADIDEHDLAAALVDCGLGRDTIEVEVHTVGLRARLGYDSIVLAAATRPAQAQSHTKESVWPPPKQPPRATRPAPPSVHSMLSSTRHRRWSALC